MTDGKDPRQFEQVANIRERDEKTEKGPVEPNKISADPETIRQFLIKENITPDNFDDRFTVSTALAVLAKKNTPGEAVAAGKISAAKEYLDKSKTYIGKTGHGDLLEQSNKEVFHSDLDKLLLQQDRMDMKDSLTEAYLLYHTIRNLAKRSLMVQKFISDKRESEKTDVSQNSLTKSAREFYGDVKKQWNKMDGKDKAIVAVTALAAAIFLSTASPSPGVQRFKDGFKKVLKIGGIAFGVNTVWKLFRGGNSLYTDVTGVLDDDLGKQEHWQKIFNSDAKAAEAVQKSTIYLEKEKFSDVAKKYQEARNKVGKDGVGRMELKSVRKSDMKPEEIYLACHTFFERYPVEEGMKRFGEYKDMTWATAVGNTMVEDPKLEFEGSLVGKVGDAIYSATSRAWNWTFATGQGLGVMQPMYLGLWGKNGLMPPEETDKMQAWAKENFDHTVVSRSDLPGKIDRHFSHAQKRNEKFRQMLRSGTLDPETGVQHREVAKDAMYAISEMKIDPDQGEKGPSMALDAAQKNIVTFLSAKYPQIKDNPYKYIHFFGGRIQENCSVFCLAYIALPGTPEFDRLAAGEITLADQQERADLDVFGADNNVEMSSFNKGMLDGLRLRFLLDSTQEKEMKSICKWFTDTYRTRHVKITAVIDAMFNNDADREKVIQELNLKQNLQRNAALLADVEDDCNDVESTAAAKYGDSDGFQLMKNGMKEDEGWRRRLALMGDKAAQDSFSYDPFKEDAREKFLEDYRVKCEGYVNGRKKGVEVEEKP